MADGVHRSHVATDLLTRAEIDNGRPEKRKGAAALEAEDAVAAGFRAPVRQNVAVAARFQAGQQVNPVTHTRLPRYARGKAGTVERDHGVLVFPDTSVYSLGDKPQHVYSVRFSARELWGAEAMPQDAVYLDMWDDYLEPA